MKTKGERIIFSLELFMMNFLIQMRTFVGCVKIRPSLTSFLLAFGKLALAESDYYVEQDLVFSVKLHLGIIP